MSAPVDVLAVMGREIGRWDGIESYKDGKDLIAARAAIAELIEADKAYDVARVALTLAEEKGPAYTEYSAYLDARDRRRAALANVRGAA